MLETISISLILLSLSSSWFWSENTNPLVHPTLVELKDRSVRRYEAIEAGDAVGYMDGVDKNIHFVVFWDTKVWLTSNGLDDYTEWALAHIHFLEDADLDEKHVIDPSVVYTLLPDGSVRIDLKFNYYRRPRQEKSGPWKWLFNGEIQCYWRLETMNWSMHKYIVTVEEVHEDFMKYKPK